MFHLLNAGNRFVTSQVSKCRKNRKKNVQTRYLIRSYDHMPRHSANNQIDRFSRSSTPSSSQSDGSDVGRRVASPTREINYGPADAMEVWQVARAATAAPLFFKPFDGPMDPEEETFNRFVDGGISYRNNPTLEGIREVRELNGHTSLGVVLSVGTARTNTSPGNGLKKTLKNILELGNDPKTVHEEVERESKNEKTGFYCFRLNDLEGTHIKMDECEPKRTASPGSATFEKMRNHLNGWVVRPEVSKGLRRCAMLLVKQRRHRTSDAGRWETFSTASIYSCPARRCEDTLSNKYELMDHLRLKHRRENLTVEDECIKRQRDVWWYQKDAN